MSRVERPERRALLGSIVIYRSPSGEDHPAIVTRVHGGPGHRAGDLDLIAFRTRGAPIPAESVPYAPGAGPDPEADAPNETWRW